MNERSAFTCRDCGQPLKHDDVVRLDVTRVPDNTVFTLLVHSSVMDCVAALQAALASRPPAGNYEVFRKWYNENYPPDTVIGSPDWHAVRIWQHARHTHIVK